MNTDSNPERGSTELGGSGNASGFGNSAVDSVYRQKGAGEGSMEQVPPGVPSTSQSTRPGGFTPSYSPAATPSSSSYLPSPSPRSPLSFPTSSSPKSAFNSSHAFDSTTPPRQSYLRQSVRTPGQWTMQESTRKSPVSSRSNSLRRKPPPPLDFSPDDSPRSQTQIDFTQSPTQPTAQTRQPRKTVLETPNRAEEQRDTLSSLPNAPGSPAIALAIPSSNLNFGSSATDLDRDDDTIGSGISYLSSSTSSSADIEADDQPRPYQPSSLLSSSTSGYEEGTSARPYQGVGLGLPFSVSAAANLSSLASRAPLSASHPLPIDIPSPISHNDAFRDPYRSPRPGENGTTERSPVADRGQLIGLGELATPRWTSAALERRWGAPADQGGDTDVFDVHEPMPTSRVAEGLVESPITARQIGRTPYDSTFSNRPFGNSGSSSLQPASLLPHSTSASSISTQLSPVGLLNFGQDNASTFGTLEFTPTSPAYSSDPAPTHNLNDHPRASDRNLRRTEPQVGGSKSPGDATLSAPSSAVPPSTSWETGTDKNVVGLGFDYSNGLTGTTGEDEVEQGTRRRISHGSVNSPATKRSSHRSSIDAKASAKHRRQSASKSSFAHLPPSPAAATASSSHSLSSSTASLPPSTGTSTSSTRAFPPPPSSAPLPSSSQHSTPSTRTPEHSRHSRHSFHSHHSSPSLVAASILRHTRDLEGIDLEIEKAAAVDEGTAEALRKLDGLSSPKMARIASGSSATGFAGEPRSRKSSRGLSDVAAGVRKDSLGEDRTRRRTRSSLAEGTDSFTADTSSTTTPGNSSPALPPKSPLANSTSSSSTSRPDPQRVPSYEVPFPSAGSPYKRGSSSSASYTLATSSSATGSHDSTSGTSFASRSGASKARRSSGGSDISSVHSGVEGRPGGVERTDSAGEGDHLRGIPPVPPLPKDWETYRPTPSGNAAGPPLSASTATTTSSISFPSPRPDYDVRRPSFASSLENSFRSSPRMPSSEEGHGSKELGKVPTPTGRRKWSISSAFHKASKSPKPGSSGMKESSSFNDLQASSQRDRKSSTFGPRLGLGEGSSQLPKRMASSTSDIASLASSKSEYSLNTTGSLGRNSIRSDKASMIARARTSSQSSSGTARTANQQLASSTMSTPAVVTTSPGRSRSSLINPRRTPSGIPFFSRKSSNNSIEPTSTNVTPLPNSDKSPGEEKNGRKSILGLNFLRSGGSKRDKDKSALSPPVSTNRSTFSTSTSSSSLSGNSFGTDEFGRRASKPSDLLTRKRGKTLSSVDAKNDDIFGSKSQPSPLPPIQMPALSSATKKRVDALNASQPSTSTSTYPKAPPSPAGSLLQTPRTRTSKLQESMRAHLPTIAGSPSTRVPTTTGTPSAGESRVASQNPSPSGTPPPPKSHTPTKIPRLGRIGTVGSSRNNSPSSATAATKTAWRRSSSFGGPGDTSHPLAASLSGSLAPSAYDQDSTSEFGSVNPVNRDPGLQLGEKTLSTRRRLESDATLSSTSGIPRSKSTSSSTFATAREPLSSSTSSSRQGTSLPRANRRPSVVEEEKRTVSNAIPIASTPARSNQPRFSSLSASAPRASTNFSAPPSSESVLPTSISSKRIAPKSSEANSLPRRTSLAPSTTGETISTSKSSRTLSNKGAIPTRVSKASSTLGSSTRLSGSGTESGRSSSASQREVDEDEVRADEEMGAYVRRQYTKKLSAGMSEEAIRKMFEFPDPTDPLPPLDAKDALSLYSRFLSPYEKEEIRDYRKVYFVGPNCEKKLATKEHTTNNYGYDDERGDYLLVPHDHLHYRYEVINVLGKGSFGQVLQCRDHKTGEMVAIKIIRNKKRFHHQALVEIKVLENLVKWDPNEKHFVIRMVDSFTFRGHLCIVTELLSINLYELVKANSFAGFSTTLIRRFTVQILGSLSLLRHHRVVHCDLKPENILLKHPAKSAIKVIDFGSSCFEHEKVYTYIQSRFYRSPEVILGMNYHMGIDMWSLGCIIAEMYTGYPIFPGENEQEQLACIMEVMGLPEKYLVDRSSRKRLFFDSTGAPRPVVNSKGRRRRPGSKTLAQVLKTDDELFVDFIAKCLIWDPDRRLKPDPAMRHPWITQNRASIPPSIPPPRASRSSALPTSNSTRFNSVSTTSSANPASAGISTPLKKQPQPASTSTAPIPRTRTFSTSTIGSSGTTRLGSKASLGLPPSSRYQVKS
ncbi:uncharacterized protein JCM6883_005375 [Sporobolomyces salmoneus]|uniref:uncharacterized protein n=1 Tax=Sporobolomyces salmoneus TaxID=183962 RepID=UPI00316B0C77